MRVAIIEDDEGICFSLRLALEDRGCTVLVYSDPTSVPYDELEADVVLVDYYMPKIDGKDVILRLKQCEKLATARIMLMSASPNLAKEAADLGVQYISKPFDLEALYEYIEAH